MTTAADDRAVEEVFEASLAGRPVCGEAAGLAAFTRAVRDTAAQPGRPNAALAELLSTGLLTDQSSPSTRTAPAAGSLPSRRSRSRTRRRFTVIVPALIAKFLSAGAVAQAATGAGVVVVVVTGAGTAGVLPDGAQETFSDLTGINETVEEPTESLTQPVTEPVEDGETADPAEVPGGEVPEDGAADGTEDATGDATDDATGDAETGTEVELTDAEAAAAWAEQGPADMSQQAWKAWMAEGSANGWVNGRAVSYWVHERNEARKAARAGEDTEETPEVEDGADEQESEVESAEDDGDGDGRGDSNGNGNGRGKGNGNGKGRSGK